MTYHPIWQPIATAPRGVPLLGIESKTTDPWYYFFPFTIDEDGEVFGIGDYDYTPDYWTYPPKRPERGKA